MLAGFMPPVLATAASNEGPTSLGCFLALALVLILTLATWIAVKGLHRVPIGARGVVVTLGRRTGEVRSEGWTWLAPFVNEVVYVYIRERQIDVPQTEYYTADRASIRFKASLRVKVSEPAALFDQGPGTYRPFTHDEQYVGATRDGEDDHSALRNLVRNSIRQSVRSLSITDVMFGGETGNVLTGRIWDELSRTARRWGITVEDVWLTEVDASDAELRQAVQSEVQESMRGRGGLAAHEAQIAKGALFMKVAADLVAEARKRLGKEISSEEAVNFLLSRYQDERTLAVAMKAAGGRNDLMNLFYLDHLGIPVPGPRAAGLAPQRTVGALPGSGHRPLALPDGSWTIGREGDIHLEWDGVSRSHARFEVSGGQMTLTDLGSTNGTFLDGKQLTPNVPVLVSSSDMIRFGKSFTVAVNELISSTRPEPRTASSRS